MVAAGHMALVADATPQPCSSVAALLMLLNSESFSMHGHWHWTSQGLGCLIAKWKPDLGNEQ